MLRKILTKTFNILWLMRIPIVSVSVLLAMTAINTSQIADYSGIIPLALIIIAGYIQNDIYDLEIDRISASSRPLPSGTVSIKEAKILYSLLVIIGLCIGCLRSNLMFFLYLLAVLLFFYIYTRFCKAHWLLKNTFTALTSTTVVLLPIFFDGKITKETILLGMAAFFFTFGREVFMDIRDRNGDLIIPNVKRLNIKTSLFLSFLFLLISRAVRESLLEFNWYRLGGYLLIAVLFYTIVNQRKTIFWYISETLKLVFIFDLMILFIQTL